MTYFLGYKGKNNNVQGESRFVYIELMTEKVRK